MKRKFKPWWSLTRPTQQSNQSPLTLAELNEHNNTMTYDVENPGLGLGLTPKCGVV